MPVLIVYNLTALALQDTAFVSRPEGRFDTMFLVSKDLLLVPVCSAIGRLTGHDEFDFHHARAQKMFAILEITGMLYLLFSFVWKACRLPWQPSWKKWTDVYELYWWYLPEMSTYSLMSFLGPLMPFVLASEFSEQVGGLVRDGNLSPKDLGVMVRWVLLRVLWAIIGFDAFLVHFRMAGQYVMQDDIGVLKILGAGVFIVQIVGVLKVQQIVQRRLFIFLFAGEDCVLDKADEVRMKMYNALLAQKIYQVTGSFVHFSVVMLTFSDYDFQKLVINTRQHTTPGGSITTVATGQANWYWPWSGVGGGGGGGGPPTATAPLLPQGGRPGQTPGGPSPAAAAAAAA